MKGPALLFAVVWGVLPAFDTWRIRRRNADRVSCDRRSAGLEALGRCHTSLTGAENHLRPGRDERPHLYGRSTAG